MEESQPDSVPLYRIENPHHPNRRAPDGVTSHEDTVGQWFSSDLETTVNYLSKSTQDKGLPVDGARLVIAHVPRTQLNSLHVTQHETAKDMDVENDNYIVPRDGSVEIQEIPLDPIIGDLRGRLNRVPVRLEALERIQKIGGISVKNHE